MSQYFMRYCGIPQGKSDKVLFCVVCCLAYCFRHLSGLPLTKTNTTVLITYNNEGAETESSSTLYNLCNTVYMNYLIFECKLLRINLTQEHLLPRSIPICFESSQLTFLALISFSKEEALTSVFPSKSFIIWA